MESLPETDNEFKQILTENTLDDWKFDPEYWQFENGILTGKITPEKILIEHSFFIWEKETVEDFELKVEFRVSERGNSGINYRSEAVEGKEYDLKGYQADIDGANEYTGQLYEEKGRAFLSKRGQLNYIDIENQVNELGTVGDEEVLLSIINTEDEWNEYHLVVRDNTHVLLINGRVMSMAIDEGKNQSKKGILGFQLHLGPPMTVEFRNLRFKKISS